MLADYSISNLFLYYAVYMEETGTIMMKNSTASCKPLVLYDKGTTISVIYLVSVIFVSYYVFFN